jgi:uncharacterized membrane protein
MTFKASSARRATMARIGTFLLATFVRGILLLVPIVLIAVLAREGYKMLHGFAKAVARLLPQERLFGMLPEDLVAVAIIAVIFLVAGLFVATQPGRRLSDRLEHVVLYRVPGYLLVRGAVGRFPGLEGDAPPEPVLVQTDEGWAIALLVERLPNGFYTVFLPESPTPTSGSVRIVEASRVRPLDASMLSLLACLTRSGSGAGALVSRALHDRIAKPDIEGHEEAPQER